jgi:hypothetical protein
MMLGDVLILLSLWLGIASVLAHGTVALSPRQCLWNLGWLWLPDRDRCPLLIDGASESESSQIKTPWTEPLRCIRSDRALRDESRQFFVSILRLHSMAGKV